MGLAVYVAISDTRAKASSLASTTSAFGTLLPDLGKQRRRDRSAP
jgi:hypothetical protein